MVIETWESVLRQRGEAETANKVAGFRKRFGDADLPYQRLGYKLALVEIEDKMNQVLPWAPPTSRHFITQIFYRGEEYFSSPRHYKPRDLPMDQWVKRAQAVMYGFWGTAARVDEVAAGFSLPHASTVRHILDRYINYSHLAYVARRFSIFTDKFGYPLFKLEQAAPYSPRVDREEIKENDDIWIYSARRYLPEVEEIVDSLENKKVVVVSAPFGTGKTFNIQHQVYWRFQEKGYSVNSIDGQIYRTSSRVLSDWKAIWGEDSRKDQPKFFAIDEASALVLGEGGAIKEGALAENEDLMGRIQSEDTRLLLINATRSADLRQAVFEHFQTIFQKLGIESVVHHVRQTHIPPELARQDLTLLGAKSDLLDFFLRPENAALLNVRLYYLHRQNENLEELRQALRKPSFFHFGPVWFSYLGSGQGGSKADLVRMLTNLGIVGPLGEEWIKQVPDY